MTLAKQSLIFLRATILAKTSMKTSTKLLISAALTILTLVLDQWTKILARESLSKFAEVKVLGQFLRLQHAENPGAFLSLGAQMADHTRFGVFTVLVFVFLVWAVMMLVRKAGGANWAFILGWTFLIAGGIGNLIDRVDKGTVTDFLIMGIGSLQTGVFNIADIAISGGIIVVLFWAREGSELNASKALPGESIKSEV